MNFSNRTYRIVGVFVAALLLSIPFRAGAGQGENIPLAARMALHKAQQLAGKDKISKAIEVLESFSAKGKSLKPGATDRKGYGHYLVNFNLGNYYLMSEKIPAAAKRFTAAVKSKPNFYPGWMNLAKCLHDMNQPGKAAEAFLKAYETSAEKKPRTLYHAGVCFMSGGDNGKAVRTFERLMSLHPGEVELEWKEAFVQVCLAMDQPRRALPLMEELGREAEGRKRDQWREVLLYQYLELKMKKKALKYVEWLTREQPLEPRWWKGLAHLHLRENRYRPALVALTVKGFLASFTDQELQIVADLNTALGVPIQAARYYEQILKKEIDPDAIFKIAQCLQGLHRPDEALEWVEKGLEREGATPRLTMFKGDLLYEMKRGREAAAAFETAARHPKNAGRAWLMAAWSAWSVGELDRARKALEKASKIPGSRRAAKKALAQLERDHPGKGEGRKR